VRRVDEKPPCEACRVIWKDKGEDPPCETCMPPLMPENEDVIKVYLAARSQVIPGIAGIIDINYLAVKMLMDLYEIKNQKQCFEGVIDLFKYFHEEAKLAQDMK